MLNIVLRGATHAVGHEDGQDMVEYALLLGMISIVAVALILLVGPTLVAEFQFIVSGLASA